MRERPQFWENTRTDGHIYQGDTLKHTFTKKHHNVSSGVSPKAENEVQQQMSTFVGWPGSRTLEKTSERRTLNYREQSKLFSPPIFPGICDLVVFFLLKYQKRLALTVNETDLPNVSSKRSWYIGRLSQRQLCAVTAWMCREELASYIQ